VSRGDRDPNRGNRRVPLTTVSAADLLGLNDDEPAPPLGTLYWWADPARHDYRPADPDRPEDGCASCGYVAASHAEAAS
jgi:hypothetical protein